MVRVRVSLVIRETKNIFTADVIFLVFLAEYSTTEAQGYIY